jgi:hypothetical protein
LYVIRVDDQVWPEEPDPELDQVAVMLLPDILQHCGRIAAQLPQAAGQTSLSSSDRTWYDFNGHGHSPPSA